MRKPTVTVLIDTFNHERFIEEAVISVLKQDFPAEETEVLIVDDGSTDRTPEILHKFAPHARVLRKQNGGQASAFNAGILEARGEIIAFLDGDDWWASNKLSRVMDAMQDSSLGTVGHGIVVVLPDGREQAETLREGFRFRANTAEGARLLRVRRSFLGTSRMTIRASLLQQIGRVPEAITIEADEYLFTMAAALSDARILPETLTYYRLHDANLYQMTSPDAKRVRRKQQAIAALASALSSQLERHNIPHSVRAEITRIVRAEADHLRLWLGEGWSWETVRSEWIIYQTLHPDASPAQRAFKLLTLLPAFLVPPRDFYRLRRTINTNDVYLSARKRWLPIPGMNHIEKSLALGSQTAGQPSSERAWEVSNVRGDKMRAAESMRQDWDERARKDAFFYIASWRKDWDERAFFESGEDDYQRLVAEVLEKRGFSPQVKNMLEIGCGVGRMTRSFAQRFHSVTAIDLSSEMLNRAQILNPQFAHVAWMRGNGTDLQPVANESVDFVFSYLVLQHLPMKELVSQYIAEMSRVLSPGGLCLFQFNGTSHSNMNWKGRMVWSLMDALWLLRFRPLVALASKAFGLDPDMAGANWHGVAATAAEITAAVRASGGEEIEMFGENTPMAWCCARKGSGDTGSVRV